MYSVQDAAKAIVKYRKDFRSFATEQLKISGQPFSFWPCQIPLLESIERQLEQRGFARCVWLKSRQVGACVDAATRVLTSDLRWISIADSRVGDQLLSVDEFPPGGKGRGRRFIMASILAKKEVYEPAFQLIMDNGESVVATGEHRFLSRKNGKRATDTYWREVSKMKIGDPIRFVSHPFGVASYEDGWFGGILDGEGSSQSRVRAGVRVTITQAPGQVFERILNYLKTGGYTFHVTVDEREAGENSKLGSGPIYKAVLGRMDEILRVFGLTRPSRFVSVDWWSGHDLPGQGCGGGIAWSRVVAIVPLGPRVMIDLQTTTGTYIAEGFVSHNSTLAQGIVAWRTMLWPHVNAIVIADEQKRSQHLFEISKSFYEQMDPNIRPAGRYITRSEIVFANPSQGGTSKDPGLRSRIFVESAHKANIAIGSNWQLAHLSEAARFPKPKLVMDGIIPAVHRVPGTILILESSAEMAGTWFRELCEASEKGQNGFEFTFVPWFQNPEYYVCLVCRRDGSHCVALDHRTQSDSLGLAKTMDLTADERRLMVEFGLKPGNIVWMREKFAEMGHDWDLFRQNYPLTSDDAWVTPGTQAFPARELRNQKDNIRPPLRIADIYAGPRVLDASGGKLWIWKEPQAGKAYDIGSDVASGAAEREDDDIDASVACVIERGTGEQVAEWWSRSVDSLELANVLYWLGTYYNSAQLAVEVNSGFGGATNGQLAKMGYCLTPDHRVLTIDMRWVPIGGLVVGDELLGFEEYAHRFRRLRKYCSSKVTSTTSCYADDVYRIVLSDGTELRATAEHPWLVVPYKTGGQFWKTTTQLRKGYLFPRLFKPWCTVETFEAGWLAGVLDGEGSVGHYRDGRYKGSNALGGPQLAIAQNLGPVMDEVCRLLNNWNIKYSFGKQNDDSNAYSVQIGRKSEVARLFGMVRTKRLLSKICPEWFSRVRGEEHVGIEVVERLGHKEIVNLSTSSKTYIAEGFPSHNSNLYIWRYRDEIVPRYTKKTGWETNRRSKPWLVGFAIHELLNKRVVVRSEPLLRELEMYVRKDVDEWGAVAKAYDDRTIAWMIAILVSDDENFERYYGLQKSMRGEHTAEKKKEKPEPWEADLTFGKDVSERFDTPWD